MSIELAANVVIAERFKLNRLLGRGGMGSVWHATHLGLDVPCAVKFIEGENASLPEAQSRFEREAKAAAALRSPHVVQILDHGIWQGTPYIAMELLDGEELGKRLVRLGRLSPPEAVRIVSQVCRALTRAHSIGVVHRDLKPDNIFVVRDDDREIAKVLDFGIAKATHGTIDGSNTKTGAMLGTPYYMSPEQAQGTKAVDHRSDLWALAVIVYQMVCGRLPFESEALGDLLVKIIVSPIPIPTDVAPWLPLTFNAWWARAAQRDPAARFQTAKEFSDSLGMALGQPLGTDVTERPPARDSMMSPPTAGRSDRPPPAEGTPRGGGTVAIALPPHSYLPGHAGGTTPTPSGPPTTGAPMSRTFGGGAASTPAARKSPGALAIAGVALAVLVLGGVATAVAVRGKSASEPPAATRMAPAAVVPVAATVTAPPAATLEPPQPLAATAGASSAPAVASAAEDAAGTASAEAPATGKAAHPVGAAAAPTTPSRPSPPAPNHGKPKATIDLGI